MLTLERHLLLLDRLAEKGRIVAKEMAEELSTSEDTIRRDLRVLASQGKLQRVHGGALPASSASANFSRRQHVSTEEKAVLAHLAAKLIEPGQLVYLDGGTTNVQLVRALPVDLDIRVVTHSPSIAVELVAHPKIEVDLIGGRLFKHSIVAIGAAASEAIRRVQPDLFVMGVTGLHTDVGATTADSEEAAVKSLILSRSAETMVLASREKLGTASPYLIAPISSLSTIVVGSDACEQIIGALGSTGSTIVQAEN